MTVQKMLLYIQPKKIKDKVTMKYRVFKKRLFGGYSKKDVNSFIAELSAENDNNYAELQRASAELSVEKRLNDELTESNSKLRRSINELEGKCTSLEIKNADYADRVAKLKEEIEFHKEYVSQLTAELELKKAECENKVLPINSLRDTVKAANDEPTAYDYDMELEQIKSVLSDVKNQLEKISDSGRDSRRKA